MDDLAVSVEVGVPPNVDSDLLKHCRPLENHYVLIFVLKLSEVLWQVSLQLLTDIIDASWSADYVFSGIINFEWENGEMSVIVDRTTNNGNSFFMSLLQIVI